MDNENMELMVDFLKRLVFDKRYDVSDALMLLNWARDHRSVPVYKHQNHFMLLSYCGRCSTIVGAGDRYCSQCGRELRGND